MKSKKDSAVISFLRSVWSNCNTATDHSWERLNHSMREALSLAIGSGFQFVDGDFENLGEFRYDRWISDPEWCYSQAIADGNYSAAVAYEKWKEREPIIADRVDPAQNKYSHMAGGRDKERLHVGARFMWKGQRVTVTSFSGKEAVACSYHPRKKGDYRERVKNVFRISRESIIEERAEKKVRDKFHREFADLVSKGEIDSMAILKIIGIETRDQFDAVSIPRLEKAAAKIREIASKSKPKKQGI